MGYPYTALSPYRSLLYACHNKNTYIESYRASEAKEGRYNCEITEWSTLGWSLPGRNYFSLLFEQCPSKQCVYHHQKEKKRRREENRYIFRFLFGKKRSNSFSFFSNDKKGLSFFLSFFHDKQKFRHISNRRTEIDFDQFFFFCLENRIILIYDN